MTSLSSLSCLCLLEGGSACEADGCASAPTNSGTGGLNSLSRLYAMDAAVFAVVATTPLTL